MVELSHLVATYGDIRHTAKARPVPFVSQLAVQKFRCDAYGKTVSEIHLPDESGRTHLCTPRDAIGFHFSISGEHVTAFEVAKQVDSFRQSQPNTVSACARPVFASRFAARRPAATTRRLHGHPIESSRQAIVQVVDGGVVQIPGVKHEPKRAHREVLLGGRQREAIEPERRMRQADELHDPKPNTSFTALTPRGP